MGSGARSPRTRARETILEADRKGVDGCADPAEPPVDRLWPSGPPRCPDGRGRRRSLSPVIVDGGRLRGRLGEPKAADLLLRARDQPRSHAERTKTETEQ